MKKSALGVLFALALAPGVALAGHGKKHHKPKVTKDAARTTALAKVPGDVVAAEYEHEDGHWIYSFEIKPTSGGKPGYIKEVNVDADDGTVVSVEDEKGE